MISISAIVTGPPPLTSREDKLIRDRLRGPNISNSNLFVEELTADIGPHGPHSVAISVVQTTSIRGSNLSVVLPRTSGILRRTITNEVHLVLLRIALTLEATTVSRPVEAATVSNPAGPSTLSSPAGPSIQDGTGLISASRKAKTTAEASVGAAAMASLCHKSKTGTVNICSRCLSKGAATVARAATVATEVSRKTGPPK